MRILKYVARKNRILKQDKVLLKICYKVWVLKFGITLNENSGRGGYYPSFSLKSTKENFPMDKVVFISKENISKYHK